MKISKRNKISGVLWSKFGPTQHYQHVFSYFAWGTHLEAKFIC